MEEAPAAEAVLVVEDVPDLIERDFLVLYFENGRRSGGGPVRSCTRRGRSVVLEFEHPDDAQRVLSRTEHVLQGVQLQVRRAAPQDPGRVLLKGLNPRTSPDLLEMYVEYLTKRNGGEYEVYRSPAGDQALVQFQEPLTDEDVTGVEERLRRRMLDGEAVGMERVPRTEKVLVKNLSPWISRDLLELYFENRRSGGGRMREVTLLSGETGAAVVAFQDWQAVDRVLKKSHVLQECQLHVSPYYDFLQPQDAPRPSPGLSESSYVNITEPVKHQLLLKSPVLRELQDAFPDFSLEVDENGVRIGGRDAVRRRQLQDQLLDFLRGVVQAHLPLSAQAVTLLQRRDVQSRLEELLKQRMLTVACQASDRVLTLSAASSPDLAQASSLLQASLCEFTVPVSEEHALALSSEAWRELQGSLSCCCVALSESGGCVKAAALRDFVQESREKLQGFLLEQAPQEMLVPMEVPELRFLQLYHQDVLRDAPVTIIPLEGDDVTGFRISGEVTACQTTVELLQTLIGSLVSHPVSLQLAGVSRFLLDERGQQLLSQVESRFRCVITGRLRWTPLDTEHELDSLNPLLSPPNFQRNSLLCPHTTKDPEIMFNQASTPDIEKIKDLVMAMKAEEEDSHGRMEPGEPASLLTQGAASEMLTDPGEDEAEAKDLDLYTDQMSDEALSGDLGPNEEDRDVLAYDDGKDCNNLSGAEDADLERAIQLSLAPDVGRSNIEEEAELLFAIQRSMDITAQSSEEEDVRRALEISLQESVQSPAAQDLTLGVDGLEAALEASMIDAIQAANEAQMTIVASMDCDVGVIAAQLCQEIQSRLKEEQVENECLRQLPERYRSYLTYLQRKHAVGIALRHSVATISGFLEYPIYATRDLTKLLNRILQERQGEVRWVWYKQKTQAVPYPATASAFIEQAWKQDVKQMDIIFDNKPYTIDFERMEEYSIGTGQSVAIQRVEPVSSFLPVENIPEMGDEIELQAVDESTEEFRQVVRPFYDTMEDFHNKIKIIKVERLSHPLLSTQYRLKKQCMERAGCQQPVERRLYHGTTEASSREICQYGFNRSFCGKNATLYGQGAYFAVKSVISVQDFYSPRTPEGNKYVFVVKVLTGDFTAGRPELRAPPQKESSLLPLRYDSVVDSVTNPTIFVIFNDTQAYPEYLITCRRI
ncbi:protein mono-ADP-ribosyltransferase PARP10 isoform X1 [Rhinatrema bivittatum]|uniref:protein mono-ADP-ribosyltransferase PARP10 isoform X1 n=1 Tax=Rhinatrema bivittatum TaxID=194408 RepID=UPI00112EE077|nr:protein mono-ADP-ribosyltransferase PARP10 isoform X1 [Rhinatrema bivittatum]XP_029448179.1 protein mono-ADP-ribosyltransferase PARP10 isoform X1 [Rhinatrema bivittatum]XP_029448180.1 protein mono-ADP-ribosyltransferase PARP10 isoform X1 [Rhinatrema bivittatum]XP_029448181.1 protein mono-ADP-ribosyltransferase PARP10 isoform X1 [Rhinatrema bivittatum]XP_029448182.1 protein mono-ADP-ribosyltransferase PARP10 isoform X1 [Rhinatrema bivittatum]XP_029448183.1 protein mono-ADP-ribosyltransferase